MKHLRQEEWISLRTTNSIERLSKEFKRRAKPMEIVAGENSCYRLLVFISLRMELAWRTTPIGKMNANLPFYKQIAEKEFTQKLDSTQNVVNSSGIQGKTKELANVMTCSNLLCDK